MATPYPITQQLLKRGIEHVCYEYANLISAAHCDLHGQAPWRTHCDDAFLLGYRKMRDFLMKDKRSSRNGAELPDILASDYLPAGFARTWAPPTWETEWQDEMDKQLAHITFEREKKWEHWKWVPRLLGDLNPSAATPTELAVVEGAEFYLYPSIAGEEYRLGDILQNREEFCVILTPHCYLATQPKATAPRADHVLTVKTVRAKDLISNYPIEAKSEQKKDETVRRYINSPAEIGTPQGRYWFLPGFLAIPDLYCDFLQLESIPLATVKAHKRIATLASPFSEALQACYLKFYTAVGLPSLQPERFATFKTIVALAKPAAVQEQPTSAPTITPEPSTPDGDAPVANPPQTPT